MKPPLKHPVWLLCILLTACATQRMPGQFQASPRLQLDTWEMILALDSGADIACKDRKVVNTEVIEQPTGVRIKWGRMVKGRWVERWTVDRCGTRVAYRVEYTADGRGGTFFNIGWAGGGAGTIRASRGETDLMRVAAKGETDTVQALLAKGADINAKDKDGWTALIHAAAEGQIDTVKALLAKGADVNVKANDGRTALMHAVSRGHITAVRTLLTKGADVNARDKAGKTALSLAETFNLTEILKLLKKAGAKP